MWNKFSHCTLLCILNYWKVSFTQKICLHLFANQYLGISIKSRGQVLQVWKVNFLVQRQRQWSKWILCPDNITAITPTVHFVYKGELKCFNAKPYIKSFLNWCWISLQTLQNNIFWEWKYVLATKKWLVLTNRLQHSYMSFSINSRSFWGQN